MINFLAIFQKFKVQSSKWFIQSKIITGGTNHKLTREKQLKKYINIIRQFITRYSQTQIQTNTIDGLLPCQQIRVWLTFWPFDLENMKALLMLKLVLKSLMDWNFWGLSLHIVHQQWSFWIWTQQMRKGIILSPLLSLAEPIPRMIPASWLLVTNFYGWTLTMLGFAIFNRWTSTFKFRQSFVTY